MPELGMSGYRMIMLSAILAALIKQKEAHKHFFFFR